MNENEINRNRMVNTARIPSMHIRRRTKYRCASALFQSQLEPLRKSSVYRSASAWLLPGNRESIWPTQGKEGYFFIYYPPLSLRFGMCRESSVLRDTHENLTGPVVEPRWQAAGWWWNIGHVVRLETTSLDAESTPRRPPWYHINLPPRTQRNFLCMWKKALDMTSWRSVPSRSSFCVIDAARSHPPIPHFYTKYRWENVSHLRSINQN